MSFIMFERRADTLYTTGDAEKFPNAKRLSRPIFAKAAEWHKKNQEIPFIYAAYIDL
ncbi:MAG: hypothetical protein IKW06_06755 [Clostridia bacterium]|nr:hypothetical protein [Clostridia bacterium]